MRAHPELLHLVIVLVLDPGIEHVFREDAALKQKRVVFHQGFQGLFKRLGCLLQEGSGKRASIRLALGLLE